MARKGDQEFITCIALQKQLPSQKTKYMKKIFTSIAMLVSMIAFTGCEKKSDTTKTTTASMTANAGGHSFATSGTMITADVQSGTMNVTGSITATQESIILIVDKTPPATGSYPIKDFTIATYGIGGVPKAGLYGTITFTSISPDWEGTFSFTCTDSTKITDGKFKIKAP
ncbi:MAG: hypothetical protein JWQ38_2991 [Flavipsychrobacter sp.]|nr:hypothetical protein [Flavipsychrobacter sp.]